MTTTEQSATAAGTGASATTAFRATQQQGASVDPKRVDAVVRAVLTGVHEAIRTHQVTYDEYQAAKKWLMDLGEGGEWPLFLDVFVEHVVEAVAAESQEGTKGSILGPYYVPSQRKLPSRTTLPARDDEEGTPLVFAGQVRNVGGEPISGAELDLWQADNLGYYSGFAPGIPEGNLRGVIVTGADGRFEIGTIQPAPYQIPTDGPTGRLVDAAGWHPWRPAHLHLIVRAPGHRSITTQLFFAGGDWLDSDVAQATKPELVVRPADDGTGKLRAEYDFVLEPAA